MPVLWSWQQSHESIFSSVVTASKSLSSTCSRCCQLISSKKFMLNSICVLDGSGMVIVIGLLGTYLFSSSMIWHIKFVLILPHYTQHFTGIVVWYVPYNIWFCTETLHVFGKYSMIKQIVIGSEKRGLMAQTIDSELTIPR